MKKLIIAGLIVCAAVASQAAQVSWAVARNSSSTIKNYTVYAVAASDISALVAALQAELPTKYASYSAPVDDYKLGNAVTAASNGAAAANGVEVGTATSIALIAFEDSGMAADSAFLYTGANDISANIFTPPDPAKTALTVQYTAFSGSGSIFSGSDTPEPTSGLLLLLGVAGLALRRKQA